MARRAHARLQLICDTNVRQASAAGRYQQMTDPDYVRLRPYWRYVHTPSPNPRHQHQAWGGLTLAWDDPFWKTHFAPNGWGCRCRIVPVGERDYQQARAEGKTTAPAGWQEADPKTGAPRGIDRGFDWQPGRDVHTSLAELVQRKLINYPPAIAQALAQDARAVLGAALPLPMDGFWGQRPGLADLPPVPVVQLTGDEWGAGLSHAQLMDKATQVLKALQASDGLKNDDTGWLLTINKLGRKKLGDNKAQSMIELKAIAGIEQLTRIAVVAERHTDGRHKNPDVKAVLRLYAPLAIDGVLYQVRLTVKDYGDPRMLHALSAIEIEDAPLGTLPAYSSAAALQQGQPTTGQVASLIKLLGKATRNDGTPYEF